MEDYNEDKDIFKVYLEEEKAYINIPGKVFRNKYGDFEDKSIEYYVEKYDISILIEFEAM
jgi:hypothetical protein